MKNEYIVTAIVNGKRIPLSRPIPSYIDAKRFVKVWKVNLIIGQSIFKNAKNFKIQVVKGGEKKDG